MSRGAPRAGDVGRRAADVDVAGDVGRSRMVEARASRTRACAAAFRRGRASTEQSAFVRKVLGAKRRERLDKNLRHEADERVSRATERARANDKEKKRDYEEEKEKEQVKRGRRTEIEANSGSRMITCRSGSVVASRDKKSSIEGQRLR